MSDRTGKRVRISLVGDFHYSGIILSEDQNSVTIKDRFGVEVTLGKNNLLSMEVIE